MMRAIVLVLLASLLANCGMRPLYSGGTSAPAAQDLAAVEVAAIPGRAGWLVRNALIDRLALRSRAQPHYRLDVNLDDSLASLAVLSDDTISRERRTLRARYQLVDLASGEILLDATAQSDAGVDVVSSEYATIAAEQTALENLSHDLAERIVRRLAIALQDRE